MMKVSRNSWHYRLVTSRYKLEMWRSGLAWIHRDMGGEVISSCQYISLLLATIFRYAARIACTVVIVWLALQLLIAVPILHFVYHFSLGESGWIGLTDARVGSFVTGLVQVSVSAALFLALLLLVVAVVAAAVLVAAAIVFGIVRGVLVCMKFCSKASDHSLIQAAHDTYVNKVCTKVELTD
jgi:hypothetical protein